MSQPAPAIPSATPLELLCSRCHARIPFPVGFEAHDEAACITHLVSEVEYLHQRVGALESRQREAEVLRHLRKQDGRDR